MMRVLGLTKAGPHGKKCIQLQAIVREALAEEQQKSGTIREIFKKCFPTPTHA